MKIVKIISILSLILACTSAQLSIAAQKKPAPKPATPKPAGKTPQPEEAQLQQILAESKRLEDERKRVADEREAALRAQEERDLKRALEESGKRDDEATRVALKNIGWTAQDAAAKKAWDSYQKFEDGAWDNISALGEPHTTLAYNYGVAHEAIPQAQQTVLQKLMSYSISALIGRAPLSNAQLITLNSIIEDVQRLSKKEEVQKLVADMQMLYTNALKRSQVVEPQKTAPSATYEFDLKKRHAGSTINNVNIVWVPVIKQLNATCGLHAVVNPHLLRQSLESNETAEKQAQRMIAGRDVPFCELEKQQASNMLSPDLIQERATALGIDPKSYSILANVLQIVTDFTAARPLTRLSLIPENLPRAIQQLQTSPHALHNFVLGNATMDPLTHKLAPGHYIGVTAEKKGNVLTLYAMDSLNEKPLAMVQALQAIIQAANPKALQEKYLVDYLKFNVLPEHFRLIRVAQQAHDYKAILTQLRAIITKAQNAQVFNHPDLVLPVSPQDPKLLPVKELVKNYLNWIIDAKPGVMIATQARNELMNL